MSDPLFILIAVSAVFIVALSKSGLLGSLGMVGVPLMTLVMPAREAAGMLLPILLVMDAVGLWAYRRQFDFNILRIMLPGAVIGIAIGWALSSFITDEAVLLLVGAITLAFVADEWLPLRKKLSGLPPSTLWGRFWGSLAGFTSFVSHTGGPPFQVYTLPLRMAPPVYAGTAVWFFAIVNTTKLVPYFFLGQLSVSNLKLSLALTPVAIVGMLLGVWLVRRISVKMFYRMTYILVFVLGLKLTCDGLLGVFAP